MLRINLRSYFRFKFYKYLESERSEAEKKVLTGLCWLIFYLLKTPKSLWPVIVEDVQNSDFKLVLRRIQWLISNSRFNFEPIKDRYFDFSIGLTDIAAKEMYQFMSSRDFEIEFDKHIVLAQLASATLESKTFPNEVTNSDEDEYREFDLKFVYHLNQAFSLMPEEVSSYANLHASGVNNQSFVLNSSVVSQERMHKQDKKPPKQNSFRANALKVYFGLLDLFEELRMPVFAISGTMLGIVREKDFLAHDYDIDIGVFEPDLDMQLLRTAIENSKEFFIKKCDYPCYRHQHDEGGIYTRSSCPVLIKIGHADGIHTDLFVHIKAGGSYWHGSSLHGWLNTKFALESVLFYGRDVLIPTGSDLYLTENYGDWRTPVSKFNCSTGTPNISVTNSCKTLCYMTKLAFDYKKKKMHFSSIEILEKLLDSGQFAQKQGGKITYVGLPYEPSLRKQQFAL